MALPKILVAILLVCPGLSTPQHRFKEASSLPSASASSTSTGERAQERIDPRLSFNYGYRVKAEDTGDEKSHQEALENGVLLGSYSVVQPDGALRTVTYRADDLSGFRANVQFQEGYANPLLQQQPRFTTGVTAPSAGTFFEVPSLGAPDSGSRLVSLGRTGVDSASALRTSEGVGFGQAHDAASFTSRFSVGSVGSRGTATTTQPQGFTTASGSQDSEVVRAASRGRQNGISHFHIRTPGAEAQPGYTVHSKTADSEAQRDSTFHSRTPGSEALRDSTFISRTPGSQIQQVSTLRSRTSDSQTQPPPSTSRSRTPGSQNQQDFTFRSRTPSSQTQQDSTSRSRTPSSETRQDSTIRSGTHGSRAHGNSTFDNPVSVSQFQQGSTFSSGASEYQSQREFTSGRGMSDLPVQQDFTRAIGSFVADDASLAVGSSGSALSLSGSRDSAGLINESQRSPTMSQPAPSAASPEFSASAGGASTRRDSVELYRQYSSPNPSPSAGVVRQSHSYGILESASSQTSSSSGRYAFRKDKLQSSLRSTQTQGESSFRSGISSLPASSFSSSSSSAGGKSSVLQLSTAAESFPATITDDLISGSLFSSKLDGIDDQTYSYRHVSFPIRQ